jgi:hypothetical protein
VSDNLNPEMNMRIYEDEQGIRRVEIDGKPFPCFTQGDLSVKTRSFRDPFWDERSDEYKAENEEYHVGFHVVMVPVFVGGELIIEGGPDVLKSKHEPEVYDD